MAARFGGVLLAAGLVAAGCASGKRATVVESEIAAGLERRAFLPYRGDRWIGNGICYSPYREGQRPGGAQPSREEIAEDLELLAPRWQLIRTFGAREGSETMLEVIRERELPMRVVLGAWIAPETRRNERGEVVEVFPDAQQANADEVRTAIRLAAAYPDIVVAIAVGNDTQVSWSAHRGDLATVVSYIRQVRRATSLPVATADDHEYWILPDSRPLAAEVDFVMAHIHPLWNGQRLEDALAWTQRIYDEIAAVHPGVPIVIGESGWATDKRAFGEQARMIKGAVGEAEQKHFIDAYSAWVVAERIPSLIFSAFDESWKGGDHPDDVEKHWGLHRADRSPKPAAM